MHGLSIPASNWSNGEDQAILAVLLTASPIIGAWLWKRRTDRHKSLEVTWTPIATKRYPGDRFAIEAIIRNRTQAHREVRWHLPEDRSGLDIYLPGRVEDWEREGSHRVVTSPIRLQMSDWVKLMFVFPTGSVGDTRVGIQLWETSGEKWQPYLSPEFLVAVESTAPSGWAVLSGAQRREFIERVLTQALERRRTSELTYDRIQRFYEGVEAGRLHVHRGPGVVWFIQGYSTVERVFLAAAAEARNVSVNKIESAVPTHGWRRLFFY